MQASSSTGSSQATGGTMSGGVTQINVGGYVMVFPSGMLLREGLRGTCVAVLLHRFDEWMLNDADGTIFIDADPLYFIWLSEKLCRLMHGWVNEIKTFDAVQPIPFYHDIFFAESPIAIDKPTEDSQSQSAFRSFMDMMGAFIKSSIKGGRGGAEVLSVTVGGRTLATTDATLADCDTLNDRFTKYGRTPIVGVGAHHVDLIVDFARRCRLSPDGAVVPPPSCADQDELVRVSEMYGVLEAMYPNILANAVMQTLLIMIGKKQPKMACLFKTSLHGSSYASLAPQVVGRRGLLFVIKCDDTNTIAVFADTKLHLPADPTSELAFECPVSLFSVCGAFEEGITKIDLPQDEQHVVVAGTQGAVTEEDGEPRGKAISSKAASLCGAETHDVAVQRVELFQVWSAVSADPIFSADGLRALVDATGMTDATPQLLYKGERDGWEPEAMFKNVGDATDLLLLLKDPSGPIIAAHIEGGLSPPADPTGEETTPCAVSLFSVRGAFEGDGITKIDLPKKAQVVAVAGRQGAVTDKDGEPCAKVCIAKGRLWLGIGNRRPTGDLRSCQVWVKKEELPADKKYVGTITNEGEARLASSFNFTLADLEIYTLQPSAGWQWVSAVASLMMDSRPT
ncbi:unnamed protein product [Vitrella brassicaformis CCMP3155]|uniref:Potassium channel tetramerisation-type BTB domain-containing protein n=1 Tax=Vitrella brassicaformis (strain CCMP3155) TaxID=1169540 RepID=A0A0G4EBS6_VITBC|nr:unnamed protein product [Vitrella brassicaformis CCMP3155]|eukprot:CEL93428.1 unnamed protein product [Vitrella brassicaformis CCMP3155]